MESTSSLYLQPSHTDPLKQTREIVILGRSQMLHSNKILVVHKQNIGLESCVKRKTLVNVYVKIYLISGPTIWNNRLICILRTWSRSPYRGSHNVKKRRKCTTLTISLKPTIS